MKLDAGEVKAESRKAMKAVGDNFGLGHRVMAKAQRFRLFSGDRIAESWLTENRR